MKTAEEVDTLMARLPEAWRNRWCENRPCACLGCVQIGCRTFMAEELLGRPVSVDPEHIDEAKIPPELRARLRPTRGEWEAWRARQ